MTSASNKPRARAVDARLAFKSAAGRRAFLDAFSHAFALHFRTAFKSAAIAGAVGSFAALRIVEHARPVSSPKPATLTELGIALAGAFAAASLLRAVEALSRRACAPR